MRAEQRVHPKGGVLAEVPNFRYALSGVQAAGGGIKHRPSRQSRRDQTWASGWGALPRSPARALPALHLPSLRSPGRGRFLRPRGGTAFPPPAAAAAPLSAVLKVGGGGGRHRGRARQGAGRGGEGGGKSALPPASVLEQARRRFTGRAARPLSAREREGARVRAGPGAGALRQREHSGAAADGTRPPPSPSPPPYFRSRDEDRSGGSSRRAVGDGFSCACRGALFVPFFP